MVIHGGCAACMHVLMWNHLPTDRFYFFSSVYLPVFISIPCDILYIVHLIHHTFCSSKYVDPGVLKLSIRFGRMLCSSVPMSFFVFLFILFYFAWIAPGSVAAV